MKINIIDIFLDPSKAAKDILAKNEKKKIKITIIILASYALISILYTSTGLLGAFSRVFSVTTITDYILQFISIIVLFGVTFGVVYFIGKQLGGKANIVDVALSGAVSYLPIIAVFAIQILAGFISTILGFLSSLLIIVAFLWDLFILSKFLSKAEQFSETNVTITIVSAVVVLAIGSSILSKIGMPIF